MKSVGFDILDIQLYNFILVCMEGETRDRYWGSKHFFTEGIYDRRYSEWESFYYSYDRDTLREFFNEE